MVLFPCHETESDGTFNIICQQYIESQPNKLHSGPINWISFLEIKLGLYQRLVCYMTDFI